MADNDEFSLVDKSPDESPNRQTENTSDNLDNVVESPSGMLEERQLLSGAKKQLTGGKTHLNENNNSKVKRLNKFNSPEVQVGFYTKTAARMMEGERKEPRQPGGRATFQMGLNVFDKKVIKVINAAVDDNPIADSVLYEIERQVKNLEAEIQRLTYDLERQVEGQFKTHDASLVFDQEYSYAYTPSIKNTISWSVLWLIKKADKYFNLVQIASKTTVISVKTANSYRNNVRRKLLSIMHVVNRYKHSNCSRSDIAYGTVVAQKAIENAGDTLLLNPDVLILQKRADTAPIISRRPTNNIDDIRDKILPIYESLMGQYKDPAIQGEENRNLKEFG